MYLSALQYTVQTLVNRPKKLEYTRVTQVHFYLGVYSFIHIDCPLGCTSLILVYYLKHEVDAIDQLTVFYKLYYINYYSWISTKKNEIPFFTPFDIAQNYSM